MVTLRNGSKKFKIKIKINKFKRNEQKWQNLFDASQFQK